MIKLSLGKAFYDCVTAYVPRILIRTTTVEFIPDLVHLAAQVPNHILRGRDRNFTPTIEHPYMIACAACEFVDGFLDVQRREESDERKLAVIKWYHKWGLATFITSQTEKPYAESRD